MSPAVSTMKKKAPKLVLSLLAVAGLLAFAVHSRARKADQFEVLTGFSSKETCSCAFVVEQTDEHCKQFGSVEGYDALKITIDRNAKTVSANYDLVTRVAKYSDAQGCVVDELK